MKRNSLCLLVLFTIAINVDAQNTSPYWSLAGNSNAANTSILGTTTSFPLRLFTNNSERVRIQTNGRVGIGTTNPVNIFTVKATVGTPAASWVTAGLPVFVGFAEAASTEFYLATASNTSDFRPVFSGKRSRGTLAAPARVANNDFITSIAASAYDGSSFVSPSVINFYVDGTPSTGHVPSRISFETGTNRTDRLERLKIGSTGNFYFNNNQMFIQQSNGSVGIGKTTSLLAKLDVVATSNNTAIRGSTDNGVAINGTSFQGTGVSGSSATGYGVVGSSPEGTGVKASGQVYGVEASGDFAGINAFSTDGFGITASTTGGTGISASSRDSYGGDFSSVNAAGIIASTTNATYAAEFNGKVYASGGYVTSDKNLKQNIHDFANAMSIINKLKPLSYEFKKDAQYAFLHLPAGSHYGLMAQDLEQVLPNLVSEAPHHSIRINPASTRQNEVGRPSSVTLPDVEKKESLTIKAVNYVELIPVMIKGMQEQQTQIDKLNGINEKLQYEIDELKSLLSKTNNGAPVSSSTGYLKQNVPNPAINNTVINYSLPANTTHAQLIISDAKGSALKVYNLSKGEGKVNTGIEDLPAGSYNYSLYINDKKIGSKQMVIIK